MNHAGASRIDDSIVRDRPGIRGFGLRLHWIPSGDLRSPAVTVQMARHHRLRAGDKNFGANIPAAGGGEFAGIRVDIHGDDAVGRREGFDVAIFTVLVGVLHELDPNRQSAMRPF